MKKNPSCLILLFLGTCIQISAQNTPWPTSGPVGIGTLNPQGSLHILGNAPEVISIIENSGDNASELILKANNKGWMWSKRNSAESNALDLFYNDGTTWIWPPALNIQPSGNIGIGTTAQTEKLQVAGNILSMGTLYMGVKKDDVGYGQRISFDNYGNTDDIWISRYNVATDATELRVNMSDDGGAADAFAVGYTSWDGSGWHPRLTVRADGQVGIGTTSVNDGTYKLYVETGIRTRKIKVDQITWADYVFDNSYTLRPLSEVEKFIKKYQHLPDVPSAAEVAKDGIDLGANQAVLLKKIEELTLYLIEQRKEIELLKEEMKNVNNKK